MNSAFRQQTTMSLPKVVFVLGGPGVGKGTQCAKIVETFKYVHLSAGELLRAERASGSKDGDLIEHHIKNGSIVPVEITCRLLETAMNTSMKTEGQSKFLIDGFPRNEDNLQGWDKQMGGKVNVLFVLFFDGTEQTCLDRALERGKNSGRSDDNIESLRKRFRTYKTSTMPIVEHFAKLGQVKTINSDRSTEEIFADVKQIFEEIKV